MLHFQPFTSKFFSPDFTTSQKNMTATITTPMSFTAISTTRTATVRVQTQRVTSEQNNGEEIFICSGGSKISKTGAPNPVFGAKTYNLTGILLETKNN